MPSYQPNHADGYASLFNCSTAVRASDLDDVSLAWFPFTLARSRISHEYSSLFI